MNATSVTKWKELDKKIAVTGQISADDIADIAAAGYKSIICNRPDGEGGGDQPASAALEDAAKVAGLQFAYMPVEVGQVSDDKCSAFHQLMQTLPGPVLAFCGSGNRAQALYTRSVDSPATQAKEGETEAYCEPVDKRQVETVAACNWDNLFDVVVVGGDQVAWA